MSEMMTIQNKQVSRLLYREQPVITLPMIDELHERPAGTAGRNFRENRDRLIRDEDYFDVSYEEWVEILNGRNSSFQTLDDDLVRRNSSHQTDGSEALVVCLTYDQKSNGKGGRRGKMIFLTERGYLLLVKPFDDELSWQVQRELIDLYFRVKELGLAASREV